MISSMRINIFVVIVSLFSFRVFSDEKCVTVADQFLDPNTIYDVRHACASCSGQNQFENFCKTVNRLMVPAWKRTSDVIAIPHRGLWGQPLSKGASENTMSAINLASEHGLNIIEIDVTFTGKSKTSPYQQDVFLGHYFSMLSAGLPENIMTLDMPPEELYTYKMLLRDQSITSDSNNRFVSFTDAIRYAKDRNILFMIDPKEPAGEGSDYLYRIMASVLEIAKNEDALKNIVIKTKGTYSASVSGIKKYLSSYSYDNLDGQFLWSPITSTWINDKTLEQTLQYIDDWDSNTQNSKAVATYEVNLFNKDAAGATIFKYKDNEYENYIDYVKSLGIYGKRSAIWSIDPMGNKGTFNRVYQWRFVGNTDDDKRGDILTTLSYKLIPYVAINTDRPIEYVSFFE